MLLGWRFIRYLIWAALLATAMLLPSACGRAPKSEGLDGGAGSEARVPAGSTAERTSGPADSLEVRVRLNARSFAVGERIRIGLVVVNLTDRRIDLSFRTSQRYDFIVKRGKTPVWRWSEGMMFAQVLSRQSVAPRDSIVYEDVWDQKRPDGTYPELGAYSILGVLAIRPEMVSEEREFGIVD